MEEEIGDEEDKLCDINCVEAAVAAAAAAAAATAATFLAANIESALLTAVTLY